MKHGNDRQTIAKPGLNDFYGKPLPWHWENELAEKLTQKLGSGVKWGIEPVQGGWQAHARLLYSPYKFEAWQDAFEWVANQFGLSRSKVD